MTPVGSAPDPDPTPEEYYVLIAIVIGWAAMSAGALIGWLAQ